MDDFDDADWRKTSPRFMAENFRRNLRIADEVDIIPIPGTKRVSRVEENIAADGIELTAEQVDKLDNLTPPTGDHHNEQQMQMIDR